MKEKDWTPSRIVGEVKIRNGSLRGLSRKNGLGSDTLRNALYRHCPKYEKIIADFLGVSVVEIWPSRYRKNTEA